MATAPTSAYHTEKDKRYLAGANDTITETRELLVAKFLQNTTAQSGDNWGDGYINSGDLPPTAANWETAKAKIMDIFKIDGMSVYANGDGRWGFIGYCHSRSSGNGLYHKTERFSGCKVPDSAHPDAEFLNDGSLNLKGTITPGAGTYITPYLAGNGFLLTCTFRGSYYNGATDYGIKWRKQGDATYNTISKGSLGVKAKAVYSGTAIDVDPTDTLLVEAPFTYEVQAYITNEEGTTLIQLLNVTMTGIAETLVSGTTAENAYLYGSSATYYRSRREAEGGKLYTNSACTTPVSAGYYMDKSGSAPYRYYICDSAGTITGISEHNPQAARVRYEPSGWGSDLVGAIYDANNTSWVPKYTIYWDPNDGKWYANDVGLTYATDGSWVVGDSPQSYEEIYITGGVQTT